jgi:carbamoyltransferase
MDYFQYCQGLTMTNRRFHDLFGGPPRAPESTLEQRHMDLASSIQEVTEDAVLRIGRHVQTRTGMRHLVLAGGVALNCVANGRLLREGVFDDIWIQPAAGDAGGSLGAALFVWHQLLDNPRPRTGSDLQQGSLLGPRYTSDQISRFLAGQRVQGERYSEESELLEHVASLLAEGKIVGWFHGRMEFGPRALGARSILGDPRSRSMQATMNLKIKFRESFRPFAPAVLVDRAAEWFDLRAGLESPYMLLVMPVREDRRVPVDAESERIMREDPDLRHRVNIVRSMIPAVTHVDYSARIQTVDEDRNPRFARLIEAFERLTGCPVLVNTSFNIRGEPIVCTPEDAYRCFLATDMDALVLEDFVLTKDETARHAGEEARERYLAQFQLD